ncbi:hypothetical protein L7F22_035609 [Adiantum nelumboides]|nr:hypothetical protein [Adiantum nelumboides]
MVLCMVGLAHADGQAGSRARRAAPYHGMRCQFSIFLHDEFNKTDVMVAQPRTGSVMPIAAPFGSLFCLNNRVTAGREEGSALVGPLANLSEVASWDGLASLDVATLSIDTSKPRPHTRASLRRLEGTLNILGIFNFLKPQPTAVAGGTSSFFLAQGFAIAVPLDVTTLKQVFRLDLDIYLPAARLTSLCYGLPLPPPFIFIALS